MQTKEIFFGGNSFLFNKYQPITLCKSDAISSLSSIASPAPTGTGLKELKHAKDSTLSYIAVIG